MNLSAIKTAFAIALMSMMSLNGFAQDQIARQAPSDKRMKDLTTIKLSGIEPIAPVDLENPASDIYSDWNNAGVAAASGKVPEGFKVDLRGFSMPTPSRRVTSNFGRRWGRLHAGIDVKVYTGDTIYAAFDGKARIVKYNARGYGYYVVLRHPNGLETLYGHLSKQLIKENQIVKAGEPIGLGGNTGRSFGSHLHFETRILGNPINPALIFDFANQDITGDFYVVNSSMVENRHTGTKMPTSLAQSGKSSAPKATRTYKVKKGDTLSGIARKQGISVSKLCKLNGLTTSSVLRVGRTLKCS
jgi:murein DD-endopeptidase MepM/ murein hydrolase activator NlpD